jgi:uncharacterized protein YgiB involved in biofilm formation
MKEPQPMKKSRSIRLVLLGSASLALAACGDEGPPQDAKFFSNVQECSAVYNDTSCREAETQARKSLAEEAPRYSRKEECEAEFGAGNCETKQSAGGGSFFMPLLMGYMMGNMLSGNRFSQPVYRGPNNSAVMPSGGKLFNVGSFAGTGTNATAFRPAAQATQVARGGFGSTATAYRSTSGS